ncbi:hypothetical protein M8J75_011509 [Diaphorina citri]|nr:hypothetical protein M8J75_011509 [Diaphorina citri]
MQVDLLKTIEDDEEVPNYSDDSDKEVEYQPKKFKTKKITDFDNDFSFVSSIEEYNKDTWNNLDKYIKRKHNTRIDDRIARARKKLRLQDDSSDEEGNKEDKEDNEGSEEDDVDAEEDFALPDDEMKHDNIKNRQKLIGKKKQKRLAKEGKLKQVEAEEYEENEGGKEFFEDAPPVEENSSFHQMNLSRPLLKAIGALNYIYPTPIQAATIPVALLGRDICGCAATGTGKTAAFMLPILERLLYKPRDDQNTRVLVLVPTRELGVQVYQVTRQLAQFTSVEVALSVGGLEVKVQESVLRKCPDIVIATPGRLLDHLHNTPSFSLSDIEVLVLDEADRMLDEHFASQMKEIIRLCSRTRQTMLFSATMTDAVNDLVSVSLTRPVRVFVDNNHEVALNLRQEFVRIRKDTHLDRKALLAALVCRTFKDHTMIFVPTKREAHEMHILLGLLGIKAGELHGNLTQPSRLESLRKFKDEETDVLIATDVINYRMPHSLEHYIHRVGRTARAGKGGVSVSMAGEVDRKLVKQVIKNAKNPVKHRIIPPEIVDKYRAKVEAIEGEVQKILTEEKHDRLLNKADEQVSKAEKMLKEKKPLHENPPREWFQTKKERAAIKKKLDEDREEYLSLIQKRGKRAGKAIKEKMDKKKKKENAEEEKFNDDQYKLQKIAFRQAKASKSKLKGNRIKSMADGFVSGKKKNLFGQANNLTDVSEKQVKMARYQAHQKKKENFMMKKRKANMKNAPKKSQEKFNMKMNRGGNKGKGGKKGGMGKGRKK